MTVPAAHPTPPTETLRHEHEVVALVVAAMDREADAIEAGAPVDVERVGKMVEFTREFTDGCHHSKEVLVLFPSSASAARAPMHRRP
jgi:hemerythrin-like domain-containing protein